MKDIHVTDCIYATAAPDLHTYSGSSFTFKFFMLKSHSLHAFLVFWYLKIKWMVVRCRANVSLFDMCKPTHLKVVKKKEKKKRQLYWSPEGLLLLLLSTNTTTQTNHSISSFKKKNLLSKSPWPYCQCFFFFRIYISHTFCFSVWFISFHAMWAKLAFSIASWLQLQVPVNSTLKVPVNSKSCSSLSCSRCLNEELLSLSGEFSCSQRWRRTLISFWWYLPVSCRVTLTYQPMMKLP